MESFGPVWLGVVIAAVITALVTTAGWFVNHARERQLEEQRRREKIIDLQKALLAEVRTHRRELEEDEKQDGGYMPRLQRLHGTFTQDAQFKPIVPLEKHDTVFSALVGEIHLLPGNVVEPVVAYYAKLATLSAFIADLREGELRKMPAPRLMTAFRDMVAVKVRTLVLAKEAEAALEGGVARLERHGRWISTRA
ncbi:hypothetical protein [Rubrimonas cliftonensis]|uniref:Uncharacterized protein n=1 Tax=Rubrimonas cliftonensis TaxID=89524 RepID=A0A1H3X0Z7_9RHOB|nr:hypothetical protein [Rubrimonas cliftonensis]SDZ92198.1 hypothetical protein SAMN05444370_102191 [Rubrimonas cliftonensis]